MNDLIFFIAYVFFSYILGAVTWGIPPHSKLDNIEMGCLTEHSFTYNNHEYECKLKEHYEANKR